MVENCENCVTTLLFVCMKMEDLRYLNSISVSVYTTTRDNILDIVYKRIIELLALSNKIVFLLYDDGWML